MVLEWAVCGGLHQTISEKLMMTSDGVIKGLYPGTDGMQVNSQDYVTPAKQQLQYDFMQLQQESGNKLEGDIKRLKQ